MLKEYLDAKLLFKLQLTKDPSYFLERFLRKSSFNITLLTIIFNYLLQQDKELGMTKISLILERHMIMHRQSNNQELYNKVYKFYNSLLRSNCYKIGQIFEFEKKSKEKIFSNTNNPQNIENDPIWTVFMQQEDEENLKKIAAAFNSKTYNDNNNPLANVYIDTANL